MLYIFYYDDESQLFYVMIDGTAVELFTTVRARTKSAGPVTIIYKIIYKFYWSNKILILLDDQ